MLVVRVVPYEDADARRLWEAEREELGERYGTLHDPAEIEPDGLIASLVGYVDEEPLGSVVVRFAEYDGMAPAAEIKRLYVAPEGRRKGYSRVLMGAAEEAARRAGVTRIILETGDKQPEAIGLYRAIGYSVIPNFGKWAGVKESICMEKDLPTRVLVISGTIGAGKSAIAWAVSDELTDRGVRNAVLEGDALAEGDPAPKGDPYNQGMMFAGLQALAPLYRKRGWGCVVIPRVVEDEGDRRRYSEAFAGPAGPAQVSIVRLVASEKTRRARLLEREPEGRWLEWALNRTVELEGILDGADVEDAVVENNGPERMVAGEVLEAIGW